MESKKKMSEETELSIPELISIYKKNQNRLKKLTEELKQLKED